MGEMLMNCGLWMHLTHSSPHPTRCLPMPVLSAAMRDLQVNLEPKLNQLMVVLCVAAEPEQLVEKGKKGSNQKKC